MSWYVADKFHPASWWLVGLTIAFSATLTSDPFALLMLCLFSTLFIYLGARQQISKTKSLTSLRFYLTLASAVVITRLLFRLVFNFAVPSDAILFYLPRLQLSLGFGSPIEFLGPISAKALTQGITEGLRLATIILGIGLATVLANPRKLLKSMPAALFEIATSVAIAINLAPQLIKSITRVRKARQLRGRSSGVSALAGIVVPVLEDTIQNSLALAASMDSRGFGNASNSVSKLLTGIISIASISLMAIGSYLLITQGNQNFYLLAIALVLAATSLSIGSLNSTRTRLISNTFSKWDMAPIGFSVCILIATNLHRWA